MSIVERSLQKVRREASPIGALGSALPQRDDAGHEPKPPSSKRILIDRAALREAGYHPETTEDRAFADQYRQIKRPVIAAALESSLNDPRNAGVIMMASALPGDGKTFTGINLAMSMARERDT